MNGILPEGWTETSLDSIGRWSSGGTPSRAVRAYFGGDIPWIKSGDLPDGPLTTTDETITTDALNHSAAKVLPAGTVSMALYGATIGKLGILSFPAATNQACTNCVPHHGLAHKRYLFYYLLSQRRQFIELGQGGAQPNISQAIVRKHPFPLAPLAEQTRIIARVEAVLEKVRSSQKRLDKIPTILKRFRQAVVGAACTGRLTADWRTSHQTLSRASSTDCPEDVAFEVPESWQWIRNRELALPKHGAICAGPFGTIFKAKDFRDEGIPIIFLRHVGEGEYLSRKPGFMDRQKWLDLFQSYSVYGGELLVAKLGDPPGTCALYPSGIGPAMVTPDVIKMEVDRRRAISQYMMYYFNSLLARKIMFGLAFGVTRLRIDLPMFKNLWVPIPPLAEQEEIVRRVQAMLQLADRLDARYQKANDQVSKVAQATLAKAFRGELVPTEAELAKAEGRSYETAEQLLVRIRALPTESITKRSRGSTPRA